MPSVTSNGLRLHYEVTGAGEPVVLLTGLGTDHSAWDLAQIPALVGESTCQCYPRYHLYTYLFFLTLSLHVPEPLLGQEVLSEAQIEHQDTARSCCRAFQATVD